MRSLYFLQVAYLVLILHQIFSSMALSGATCQKFKFVVGEDVVFNYILEGHVFQRVTVLSATQCHVRCKDNCLCVSMNYFPQSKENNCDLNDANREMVPAAIKWRPGGNYYDLVRSYTVKGGDKYSPGKHHCVNRCCHSNPCLNGGVCQELCDTFSPRFNCTCPGSYSGQRCEKMKQPRSCKDIASNGALISGKYDIFNSANESIPVHCDLKSEVGFKWALIQSFSLANKDTFKRVDFGRDYSVNETNSKIDWNPYRLSLSWMQSLADHSTHLRTTCNFVKDGLQYTDYARAKLVDQDIFGRWDSVCRMYEYINIRGNNCSDCTAMTKQNYNEPWTIKSRSKDCTFDEYSGSTQNENNFGRYHDGCVNINHHCTSSPASIT